MGNVMRPADEKRFDGVFVHLDAVARYARRRGARDPEPAGDLGLRQVVDEPQLDQLPLAIVPPLR